MIWHWRSGHADAFAGSASLLGNDRIAYHKCACDPRSIDGSNLINPDPRPRSAVNPDGGAQRHRIEQRLTVGSNAKQFESVKVGLGGGLPLNNDLSIADRRTDPRRPRRWTVAERRDPAGMDRV